MKLSRLGLNQGVPGYYKRVEVGALKGKSADPKRATCVVTLSLGGPTWA